MAATSKSPQQNSSPRDWRSRRTSLAPGLPSSMASTTFSNSPFGGSDQEVLDTYSSYTVLSKEESAQVEDDSTTSAGDVDAEADISEIAVKKPAWNKPSGGGATSKVGVGGVLMGAESWPALSESARASPKAASSDSLKGVTLGSQIGSPVSQAIAECFLSPHEEVTSSISTPNSSSSTVGTTHQRSMKGGGGSSSNSGNSSMAANGCLSQAPSTHIVVEVPLSSPGKSSGSVGESSQDNTHKDAAQRRGSYGVNEVSQQRSSFRRNNNGSLSRGDGSYLHNHGTRRGDQERGKREWVNRSFNGRETHGPQQRVGTRPFTRGLAPNTPYIPPSPIAVRPFITPMVYTEVPSPVYYVAGPHPDSLRHMPMVPMSPLFFPMPDPHLPSKIVNQIDYYFSSENLVKDTFLRQNMDGEGWVPIKLIAGFKKVMQLTGNIQLILDAIQASDVVEVQGDKVRRRTDWVKWVMSPAAYSTVTSPLSISKSSPDVLAAHLNNVTLDEQAAK